MNKFNFMKYYVNLKSQHFDDTPAEMNGIGWKYFVNKRTV